MESLPDWLSAHPLSAFSAGLLSLIVVLLFLYLSGLLPRFPSALASLKLPEVTLASPTPGVSVCSIQGRRRHMEDAFSVHVPPLLPNHAFLAVFDGHGGSEASQFLSGDLHSRVFRDPATLEQSPADALRSAIADSEEEILRRSVSRGWCDGSTAICVLVAGDRLVVGNVGDSRCVLGRLRERKRAGGEVAVSAVALSRDHKPGDEHERKSIEERGGRIVHMGTWRVEGVLALSRAFGDRHLKEFISAVPDIVERRMEPEDRVLVLASDGLWDAITSDEAVRIAYKHVGAAGGVDKAAQMLVQTAFQRGSMDNITCIVVDLLKFTNFLKNPNTKRRR